MRNCNAAGLRDDFGEIDEFLVSSGVAPRGKISLLANAFRRFREKVRFAMGRQLGRRGPAARPAHALPQSVRLRRHPQGLQASCANNSILTQMPTTASLFAIFC